MSDEDKELRNKNMMLFREACARRIQDGMESKRIKQDDLSNVTHLSLHTISAIVRGKQNVNAMDLVHIAEKLGCSLEYLLTGKENEICIRSSLREALKRIEGNYKLQGIIAEIIRLICNLK